MVTVDQAEQIILDHLIHLTTEKVDISEATGRVLRESIIADRDFPPYDRVSMDGIAIDYEVYASGVREFQIAGTGAAGAPQIVMSNKSSCIEIMTGAILPVGTDTVVRYEDLQIEDGKARVTINSVKEGQNVHKRGIDRRADSVIVKAGKKITPAEIGVLATVGMQEVSVLRNPSICIISTGDEVIPVNQKPLPHQIRSSNTHTIASILGQLGLESSITHLDDDEEMIMERLEEILGNFEVIVLSGGVSKGKFDFIPDCLAKLGVVKHFHRIAQRPGKPFWFGSKDRRNFVFALPGNPVSTTLCAVRYLLPWLQESQGLSSSPEFVKLANDVDFKPDLTLFQQCLRSPKADGSLLADPVFGHGSGDLASLTDSNGFVELPKGRNRYNKGEVFRWWKL